MPSDTSNFMLLLPLPLMAPVPHGMLPTACSSNCMHVAQY